MCNKTNIEFIIPSFESDPTQKNIIYNDCTEKKYIRNICISLSNLAQLYLKVAHHKLMLWLLEGKENF